MPEKKDETVVEAKAEEIVVETAPENEDEEIEKFITINRKAAYHKVQKAGGFVRTKITYFVAGAVAAVGTLAVISAVKNNDPETEVAVPEMDETN